MGPPANLTLSNKPRLQILIRRRALVKAVPVGNETGGRFFGPRDWRRTPCWRRSRQCGSARRFGFGLPRSATMPAPHRAGAAPRPRGPARRAKPAPCRRFPNCLLPALHRVARPCRASRAPDESRSPSRDRAPLVGAAALSSSTDWRSISGGRVTATSSSSAPLRSRASSLDASFIGKLLISRPTLGHSAKPVLVRSEAKLHRLARHCPRGEI